MEFPYECWYLDLEEYPEDGGYFMNAGDAATAEEALSVADTQLQFVADEETPHAFDRARKVRTAVPAEQLHAMDDEDSFLAKIDRKAIGL